MKRKRIMFCEREAPSFLISENLYWHLCCPNITEVCKVRDTFWRILFSDVELDHWWKRAAEIETLLFNLHDWSI